MLPWAKDLPLGFPTCTREITDTLCEELGLTAQKSSLLSAEQHNLPGVPLVEMPITANPWLKVLLHPGDGAGPGSSQTKGILPQATTCAGSTGLSITGGPSALLCKPQGSHTGPHPLVRDLMHGEDAASTTEPGQLAWSEQTRGTDRARSLAKPWLCHGAG